MSPTTGWLLMGGWLLLSIIVGLFLGAFIKAGKGPENTSPQRFTVPNTEVFTATRNPYADEGEA